VQPLIEKETPESVPESTGFYKVDEKVQEAHRGEKKRMNSPAKQGCGHGDNRCMQGQKRQFPFSPDKAVGLQKKISGKVSGQQEGQHLDHDKRANSKGCNLQCSL
jgi:hypothetical protein